MVNMCTHRQNSFINDCEWLNILDTIFVAYESIIADWLSQTIESTFGNRSVIQVCLKPMVITEESIRSVNISAGGHSAPPASGVGAVVSHLFISL